MPNNGQSSSLMPPSAHNATNSLQDSNSVQNFRAAPKRKKISTLDNYENSNLFIGYVYYGDPKVTIRSAEIGHQAIGIYSYQDGTFYLRQIIGLRARPQTDPGLFEILSSGVHGLIQNEAITDQPLITIENSFDFNEEQLNLFFEFLCRDQISSNDKEREAFLNTLLLSENKKNEIIEIKQQDLPHFEKIKKLRELLKKNMYSLTDKNLQNLYQTQFFHYLCDVKLYAPEKAKNIANLIPTIESKSYPMEGCYVQIAAASAKSIEGMLKRIEELQQNAQEWSALRYNCHSFASELFEFVTGINYDNCFKIPLCKGIEHNELNETKYYPRNFEISKKVLESMSEKEKEDLALNHIGATFLNFVKNILEMNKVSKIRKTPIRGRIRNNSSAFIPCKKALELREQRRTNQKIHITPKIGRESETYSENKSNSDEKTFNILEESLSKLEEYINKQKNEESVSSENQGCIPITLSPTPETPKQLLFSETLKRIEENRELLKTLKKL